MFRPLDFSKLKQPPATVATTATKDAGREQVSRNVANVAIVASPNGPDCDCPGWAVEYAFEERAGLAADRIAPAYLDAWARLNCQTPASVSDAEWRLALDDGGRFLDAWGEDAAALGWTPGELFDVPRAGRLGGLVWQLNGAGVEALGADHVRATDGRMILRDLASGGRVLTEQRYREHE